MPDYTLRRLSNTRFADVIGCTEPFGAWDAVAAACAREFQCCDEDVSVEEAEEGAPDEGTEYLTVKGVRVGVLCPYMSGRSRPAGVHHYAEAAE